MRIRSPSRSSSSSPALLNTITTRYDQKNKQKVGVFLELENSKKNNLGMPLPKGTVRVYKEDKDGSLQFVGEDEIDHTPKDEKFKIKIGEAFDVVGERIQTDYKRLADNLFEVAFEVSLRNHKKEDIKVLVEEPIPGDWEMLSNSHPYEKVSANLIRFDVPVAKDKEVKVKYRIRFQILIRKFASKVSGYCRTVVLPSTPSLNSVLRTTYHLTGLQFLLHSFLLIHGCKDRHPDDKEEEDRKDA